MSRVGSDLSKRGVRAGAVMLGVGACTMLAPPVFSQQPKERAVLEEVIVTARYREELLQETPIAITAITAEDIQVRSFSSAYEIGYTVPNAAFRQTQAAFGNSMSAFIRGIGQYDFLAEFEPGVGIYFDDVLHPVVMGSMVDLLDLERVEVLRGPQGTLFGRGSIGGAVRYVSKKPQGDNTGNIQLTVGRYDRVDVRASYDFGFTDNLFARITGVSKRRDGFQKVIDFACANPGLAGTIPTQIVNRNADCLLGTQGGEDVTGARAALRWVGTEDFELLFTADYQNDSSEARADRLINVTPRVTALDAQRTAFDTWSQFYLERIYGVPFDNRFVPADNFTTYATYSDARSGLAFEPVTAIEQTGVSAKADWAINDAVRSEFIVSYREFDSQFATDADQSPFNEQTVDGRQEFDSRTAELRFSGRAFDRLDWTVGGFYYKGDFRTAQTVSIPAIIFNGVFTGLVLDPNAAAGAPGSSLANPLIPLDVAADIAAGVIDGPARFLVNGLNITESENNSVFAHGVYDLTDRLSFTGGMRYSEDDKAEDFDNSIVITSLATTDSHFDWKAGVDFKLTDETLLYVSAATGYRPQAFNPRPFQVTQFVQVDGEEARSYEIGVKADLFDRRLRLNVAGFFIDYNKRITPVAGTECLLVPGSDPPVYATVPPGTPGSVVDTLGNTCLATTSRTFYQNIPGDIEGVELELTFRPVDALRITGTIGYIGWSSDDLDDPGSVFGINPVTGQPNVVVVNDRPIYVPEYNWSVAASYEFGMDGGSTFTPRVDVYGQSEICSSITTEISCADGYELTNARVEWANAAREWIIALGATNVTDEEYLLNTFDLTAFGQPTTEGQPGRPREWYLQLIRNF